jgi:tetratricopeptide (TPR) repeat protein
VSGPSTTTIKKLFAVSGNQCAFPGCIQQLVDTETDTVVGEICHIKAQSPKGPRYDPQQTDDERHGFDNLLLLCHNHHKAVDDHPETYTVETLREYKTQREDPHAGGLQLTDDVARQFLARPAVLAVPLVLQVLVFIAIVVLGGAAAVAVYQQYFARELRFPVREEGETLIILVPYAGELREATFAPERVIRDELQVRVQRLEMAGQDIRLEIWDQPVSTAREAREVGARYRATLVVWGEFDDVVGVTTFVEVTDEVPQPDIQLSGNIVPLATLAPGGSEAWEIGHMPADCLTEALPHQADYLATMALGLARLVQPDLDEAGRLFGQSVEALQVGSTCQGDPRRAYYWLGQVNSLQERYPEALAYFTEALALEPDFKYALAQRGAVYLAMGYAEEAAADFAAALDLVYEEDKLGQAALYTNIGLARQLQGQVEEAGGYYQRAWEIIQEHGDTFSQARAWELQGGLYQQKGQLQEALDCYDQALELYQSIEYQKGIAVVLGNVGLVHYSQGQFDAALGYFQDALAIDRSIGYVSGQGWQLVRIGLVYLSQHDLDRARVSFEEALETYTSVGSPYGEARAYVGIGLRAHEEGDVPDAISAWEKAFTRLEAMGSPDAQVVGEQIQNAQSQHGGMGEESDDGN